MLTSCGTHVGSSGRQYQIGRAGQCQALLSTDTTRPIIISLECPLVNNFLVTRTIAWELHLRAHHSTLLSVLMRGNTKRNIIFRTRTGSGSSASAVQLSDVLNLIPRMVDVRRPPTAWQSMLFDPLALLPSVLIPCCTFARSCLITSSPDHVACLSRPLFLKI